MAAGFFAKLRSILHKPDKDKALKFAIEQGKNDVPTWFRNMQEVKDMVKRLDKEKLEKEANGKIGLANPFA